MAFLPMSSVTIVMGLIAIIVGSVLVITSPKGVMPPHIPYDSPTFLFPPWPIVKVGMTINDVLRNALQVTTPPSVQVIQLATAYWKSEVVYALTKNGIFDVFDVDNSTESSSSSSLSSSLTCVEVADKIGLLERPICEYMRAGALLGLFRTHDNDDVIDKKNKKNNKSSSQQQQQQQQQQLYSLSVAGTLLQSDVVGSLRDFTLMINEESKDAWRAAGTQTVRSGVSGFREAFGSEWWDWHNTVPQQEAQFDRAMTSFGFAATGAALIEWQPTTTKEATDGGVFCDIGGGVGTTLQLVLAHYPDLKGIVLDQPSVIDRAVQYLAKHGQSDRAHGVAGSFFEPLPDDLKQCDTFFLKFILHDWGDEECISILKNIKAVAKPGAKIVIMEQVLGTTNLVGMETSKMLMSINMLAGCKYGARERTVTEYQELFHDAGIRTDGNNDTIKVIPTRDIYSLIEVEL